MSGANEWATVGASRWSTAVLQLPSSVTVSIAGRADSHAGNDNAHHPTFARERVSQVHAQTWSADMLRHLRDAQRRLLRTPALSACAVLCLALGLGATTAMWTA